MSAALRERRMELEEINMEKEVMKELEREKKEKEQKRKNNSINPTSAMSSNDIFKNAYEGRTDLVLSAVDRNPALLTELVAVKSQEYKDILYVPSTLLHFACRGDRRELALELVKRGADPHLRNHIGDSALTGCDRKFTEELLNMWDHHCCK